MFHQTTAHGCGTSVMLPEPITGSVTVDASRLTFVAPSPPPISAASEASSFAF